MKRMTSQKTPLVVLLFALFVILPKSDAQTSGTCGANNKVKMTYTELIDDRIDSLIWINNTQIVFALTRLNGLYRSSDDGRTWESQLPYMRDAEVKQPISNRMGVRTIQKTSEDGVLYFLGWNGKLWLTKNYGQTYSLQNSVLPIEEVTPHPTKPAWLLGNSSKCESVCYAQLHLSQDFGITWRLLDTYVYLYTWANAGVGHVPEKTIWILGFSTKSGQQYAKSRFDLQLKHSVDFFATTINHPTLQEHIVYLLHHNHNMYLVQEPVKYGGYKLLVSENDGETFLQARFPSLQAEDQYMILDDTEGSIFINVRHGVSSYGDLYVSDKLGSTYILSLAKNRRTVRGVDFGRMEGLEGIYLANYLDGRDVRTVISYDKGGEWDSLPVPISNSGTPVPCNDPLCQLNIHGVGKSVNSNADYFGPLHSDARAVGLMLATGNVGTSLQSTMIKGTNTYFTRDAGWTWYEIRNGSHIYEFADYGALIVMADNIEATNKIIYTLDQGLTFLECQIPNAVEITNIVVEPSASSESFVVYGYRNIREGKWAAVLIHLNFTEVHDRQCETADYEQFTPYDDRHETEWKCLMGETVAYTRRKRDAACYNPTDFTPTIVNKNCPCTHKDYECDFCHQRTPDNLCARIPDCEDAPTPPLVCKDFYNVTKGYRLKAGTKCDVSKGLNLLPTRVACPKNTDTDKQTNHKKLGVIALVVSLCTLAFGVVAGVIVYLYRHDDRIRRLAGSTGGNGFQQHHDFGGDDSTALDEDLLTVRDNDNDTF